LVICGLGILPFAHSPASAAPGDLLLKLNAPPRAFGGLLAIIDDDILLGNYEAAHLFDGTTGQLKLTFSNPNPRDEFFATAAAGGDGRVFISTSGLEEQIYVHSTFSGELLQVISSPDGNSISFGSSLAYSDGKLLASAPAYSGIPFLVQSFGQAYVFDAASGMLERRLLNPEPAFGDLLGHGPSLALFGERAVVGALGDRLPGEDGDIVRRVWVFDRNTGDVVMTLENPNPASDIFDWFGSPVAANPVNIVVGAQEDATSGIEGSGTVYVFDSSTGELKHTLFSPHVENNGEFGRSVAVTPEGHIFVGAFLTSVNGIDGAGHAYLFDGLTGNLLLDLTLPEPREFSGFGFSVAAMPGKLLVDSGDGLHVFEGIPEPSSFALGSLLCVGGAVWQARRFRRMRPVPYRNGDSNLR
jgi:outer membrane protein assembly factor BamB